MFDVCDLLRKAEKQGASTLYLKAGSVPQARKEKERMEIFQTAVTAEDILECLLKITTAKQRSILEESGQITFAWEAAGVGRYRVSVWKTRGEMSMVFGRIPPIQVVNEEMKNLQESMEKLVQIPEGLVLFAGNAGSGRTSSMAAVVHKINQSRPAHILTLENPVEIVQDSKMAMISQREAGTDYKDEAAALKAVLKEKVDVLLYEDGSDKRQMLDLCEIALSGSLVLTDVYGNTLPEVMQGIMLSFKAEEREKVAERLAQVLRAVVFCKRSKTAEGVKQEWNMLFAADDVKKQIRNSF